MMKKIYTTGDIIEAEFIYQKLISMGVEAEILTTRSPLGIGGESQIYIDKSISDSEIVKLIESIKSEQLAATPSLEQSKPQEGAKEEPKANWLRYLIALIVSAMVLFLSLSGHFSLKSPPKSIMNNK